MHEFPHLNQTFKSTDKCSEFAKKYIRKNVWD